MPRLTQPKFNREFQVLGSDLISKVQYDPKTYILDATLHSGERYRYRDVGSLSFTRFITAKSAGSAFSKYIKKAMTGEPRDATKLPRK